MFVCGEKNGGIVFFENGPSQCGGDVIERVILAPNMGAVTSIYIADRVAGVWGPGRARRCGVCIRSETARPAFAGTSGG